MLNPQIISIPDYGQVGAGTVVEFLPRGRYIDIVKPDKASLKDELFSHSVSGDSLYNPYDRDTSVRHNDVLICKGRFELSEIKPDKICIVFIVSTCERLAKKVIIEKGGKIILRSPNPTYPDRRYDAENIEVVGIVVAFQRYV